MIPVYVAGVFVIFIAVSFFVFHSTAAVKALVAALAASFLGLLPGFLSKIEYRLTEKGLEKRAVTEKKTGDFKTVYSWDQLRYVIPINHGFKYYLQSPETNPLRAFWNRHISDTYSGDISAEKQDRDTIIGILNARQIPAVPRRPGLDAAQRERTSPPLCRMDSSGDGIGQRRLP